MLCRDPQVTDRPHANLLVDPPSAWARALQPSHERATGVSSDGAVDGLTKTIVLDDSNEALTTDYEYRDISASEGIAPTWDAGVVVKSGTVSDNDDNDNHGDGKDNNAGTGLPSTGATIGLALLALAMALLGVGGWLLVGRRKADPSDG